MCSRIDPVLGREVGSDVPLWSLLTLPILRFCDCCLLWQHYIFSKKKEAEWVSLNYKMIFQMSRLLRPSELSTFGNNSCILLIILVQFQTQTVLWVTCISGLTF
uniref:Uncharacterized protein n=1 Tax=Cyanoderma ruficeps TaxID=181631 RepID=A0A8C3RBI3_9PASS